MLLLGAGFSRKDLGGKLPAGVEDKERLVVLVELADKEWGQRLSGETGASNFYNGTFFTKC